MQSDLQKWVDGKAHDYLTWLGSESASQNYETGVRVNVKIRGSVRWDTVKHPKDMSTWIKTSFARRRETNHWYLVASRVPMSQQTMLADVLDGDGDEGHMDSIVFAQPGDHGSGEKRKKEFRPPVPPKPRRNVAWKDGSYDQPPGNWDRPPAVVLKGNGKSLGIDDTKSLDIDDTKSLGVESDVEETPNSKCDCVSPSREPTPVTRSPTTEVSTESPGDSSIDVTALMAIGEDDDPLVDSTHKTTMSKKQRKQFVEGLEIYNHHEMAVGVNFGFRDENFTGANCSIVTSHPQIFWHQDNFNVYDVGKNADHLDQNEKAWNSIFQDVDLVVVAIAYDDPEVVLGHRDLLHELESFSDITGLKFLHIDIINTDRWNQHATPQTPYMCDGGELGFTSNDNDEELASRFLGWANDKSMDDVLGSDFAEWMCLLLKS